MIIPLSTLFLLALVAGVQDGEDSDGPKGFQKGVFPEKFMPGAGDETIAQGMTSEEMGVLGEAMAVVREKLEAGEVDDLLHEYASTTGPVICLMLSDEETVARNAFVFMNRMCREKLELKEGNGEFYSFDMTKFNSSFFRAAEWSYWSTFWNGGSHPGRMSLREMVEGVASMEARMAGTAGPEWEELLAKLRNCGDYDEGGTPDHLAFQRIRKCGRAAWPNLAKYLTHEDISMAKTANHVLNKLTGREVPWERAFNRDQSLRRRLREEWETWIELGPDEEMKALWRRAAPVLLNVAESQFLRWLASFREVEEEDRSRVSGFLVAMDDDDLEVRQKATDDLREMGLSVMPILLAVDREPLSLEVRIRLSAVIARLDSTGKGRGWEKDVRLLLGVVRWGSTESIRAAAMNRLKRILGGVLSEERLSVPDDRFFGEVLNAWRAAEKGVRWNGMKDRYERIGPEEPVER